MKTLSPIAALESAVAEARTGRRTIGFVPTMGYLHEGHLSLVRECRKRSDVTVASIFVNPLQFGPREDFRRYPRDPERDAALLDREGVDILFLPETAEMYPPGFRTSVEVGGLQDTLCGRSRPGHFRGVATVVLKLFNIVRPDCAFFGQKDAQQVVILRRMAEDLNLDIKIVALPIVREPDGLAMSSRNIYLNIEERRAATILFRGLEEARRIFEAGERAAPRIRERLLATLASEPLARLDYAEVVDPGSLEPVERVEGEALIALAVFFGRTRLIDNIILGSMEEAR
ncbi:MAG: Pantothenate synthetase [Candidatus Aminicenantes bacterium]|nr:Pantothenate synthetase [Candidatus Aminicenantes bacterium]